MGVKVREKIPGSKEYWVFWHHRGERGSEKIGPRKVANRRAEEILEIIKTGKLPQSMEPDTPLLSEFYERYIQEVATTIRPSTRKSYKKLFKNHILPKLGNLRLHEITRDHVKKFAGKLVSAGKAKNTVRNCMRALSACFTEAVEADDIAIQIDPVKKFGRFIKQAKEQVEINPWTREEAERFLITAAKKAPDYLALFLTVLHTGLRSGEIAGLQWTDIDFAAKTIRVRRQVQAGVVSPLKTEKSRRTVDMSDELAEELSSWKVQQKISSVWVFPNHAGKPADMQNVKNRHFVRCIKAANEEAEKDNLKVIRRIRFQDCRHTFASLLLASGESLKYIQSQLGHTSIRTTADIYAHLIEGSDRQAINKLPKIPRETSALVVVK